MSIVADWRKCPRCGNIFDYNPDVKLYMGKLPVCEACRLRKSGDDGNDEHPIKLIADLIFNK